MLAPGQKRPSSRNLEKAAMISAALFASQDDFSPDDLEAFYLHCGGESAVFVLEASDGASSGTDVEVLRRLFGSPAGRALLKRGPSQPHPKAAPKAGPRRGGWAASAASGARSAEAERRKEAEAAALAAGLLGPPCSLSDSCRCIECQSNYLDCGDDDGLPQLCSVQ